MEERVIALNTVDYNDLKKILNSGQSNLYFQCQSNDQIISIPIYTNSKKESNKEVNIVQRWIKDIMEIAEKGSNGTNSEYAKNKFDRICSYCNAVIVSVTS